MIAGPDTLTIVPQQWLADYWLGKCAGRSMPNRADIDPVEIRPKVLPNLSLMDVAEEPRHSRFRLAGTAYREALGGDPTGKRLDQLPFTRAAVGWQIVGQEAVAECRPAFEVVRFVRWDGVAFDVHCLRLPLSEDGERVSMILGHDVFVKQRALFEYLTDRVMA
jgi:hypothetical protein